MYWSVCICYVDYYGIKGAVLLNEKKVKTANRNPDEDEEGGYKQIPSMYVCTRAYHERVDNRSESSSCSSSNQCIPQHVYVSRLRSFGSFPQADFHRWKVTNDLTKQPRITNVSRKVYYRDDFMFHFFFFTFFFPPFK